MKEFKTTVIGIGFEEDPEDLESPQVRGGLWTINCYSLTNKMALKAARFIATWNGYRLVKEPKEVK